MRLLLVAALLAIPSAANAQTLYRCVEKGKPTSFQSEPCNASATVASTVDYVPERDRPRPTPAPAPAVQYQQRQAHSARLHNIPRAPSLSACEAARRHREQVLGTNNQQGNVDVRRMLNDAVAKACN